MKSIFDMTPEERQERKERMRTLRRELIRSQAVKDLTKQGILKTKEEVEQRHI